MKHIHKNNKGFTLLEIIVVIIIIGVLAGLALPRFLRTVEYSRSAEALSHLSAMKQSMERCALPLQGDFAAANCTTLAGLDVEDPTGNPGSHFTYADPGGVGANTFTLTATRNALDGGDGVSTITLTYNAGAVTRAGTNVFSAIR